MILHHLPKASDLSAETILNGFLDSVSERHITLYPAQEEAVLEIMAGKNIILSTPTGSGKSLVATAMHFKALAEGKRSYYTCPIKALVSEKFFALCDDFGPENVGMLTGDASINRDAPIICCTAEILSNMALSEGEHAPVEYAIMDEFHYYSDAERGMAWQVPLLMLSKTTFLLMSATLGDSSEIEESLRELNHLDVAVIRSSDRPVPLDYSYRETPIHETLFDLISSHRFPIYVVNFTQRDCTEQAQDAMSVNICTKEEKKKIEEAFAGFRFDTPFGKEIRRYIGHGIGLHHAGLLPKYRLLVEKLAQAGLLKIIMGTDTLGVGVNIPIRTVLFTKLCKFDGQKTGILSVRDFKQISGRAGRKGFDDQGSVVCQAPEHVIENKRAESKFTAADKGKKKKFVKKDAPTKNFVYWDEKTFQRLIDQQPEPLSSKFWVSHATIMLLLQTTPTNANPGYKKLISLITKSHEVEKAKSKHRKQAAMLFKSLVHAGIVSIIKNREKGARVVVSDTLQKDFSLHHALSLYMLDALRMLDMESETYAADVLSLVESILENPTIILQKQVDKLKTERMAEMRTEGLEYEQRMDELEKIEHPKPLRDFTYGTFNAFADKHPWVGTENIQPKSVAREMFERVSTFNQYVSEYGLQRSEGLLLRYLSGAYKALMQTVPDVYKTDEVHDVIAYLRAMLGKVDTSLIEEWEQMLAPAPQSAQTALSQKPKLPFDPEANPRAFAARIRAEMHALVKALAERNYDEAAQLIKQDPDEQWTTQRLQEALAPFYAEYERILFDNKARQPHFTLIKQVSPKQWGIQQVLLDPAEDNAWMIEGTLLWGEDISPNEPMIMLERIGS